jgi:hypothetical protein
LVILLGLGLGLFAGLKIVPLARQRTALTTQVAAGAALLETAERAQAGAPARARQQVTAAQARVDQAAAAYLSDGEAAAAIDRLYAYGSAAGVQIVDLQVQPNAANEAVTQKVFSLRASGTLEQLLDFMTRIQEVTRPGYVIDNLKLAVDTSAKAAPGEDKPARTPTPYTLALNVVLFVSRYAPPVAAGETTTQTVSLDAFAHLRQRLEDAWASNDWEGAMALAQQIEQTAAEGADADEIIYRAHVNFGYHLLASHRVADATGQFEAALAVKPAGQEALFELQQIRANAMVVYAVEEKLVRDLQRATTAGDWQEVIRLLRLIQTVNPGYVGLAQQLREAYIHYGDQLKADGQLEAAQEQYKQAELFAAEVD